jgi:hypothetical protein
MQCDENSNVKGRATLSFWCDLQPAALPIDARNSS